MDFHTFCTTLVTQAGELLQQKKQERFSVTTKDGNPKDIVTSLDIEVGEFITSKIKAAYPEHGIHNEEADEIEGDEYLWAIDPIDGSAAFARGIPQYAISIGLLHHGVPIAGAVLDPSTGELFSFEKDKGVFLNDESISVSNHEDLKPCFVLFSAGRKDEQREWGGEAYKKLLGNVNKTKNFSSSALSLCYIAAGRIEGVIAGTLTTLDIAAAVGILNEAGGVVCTADQKAHSFISVSQRVYAANNQQVVSKLIELLESE